MIMIKTLKKGSFWPLVYPLIIIKILIFYWFADRLDMMAVLEVPVLTLLFLVALFELFSVADKKWLAAGFYVLFIQLQNLRTSIIDYDDLNITICLIQYRINTFINRTIVVMKWNDHTDHFVTSDFLRKKSITTGDYRLYHFFIICVYFRFLASLEEIRNLYIVI